jgi:hypothetical protein
MQHDKFVQIFRRNFIYHLQGIGQAAYFMELCLVEIQKMSCESYKWFENKLPEEVAYLSFREEKK